ncbi:F-box only protein 48 [Phyllobates terribilis]|uniref:F-box only protein 48 n=1 Tax=Phyllobates terribilis TaxID=111132 RepID=UPI003CCB5CF0
MDNLNNHQHNIDSLPPEMILEVLKYLDLEDLLTEIVLRNFKSVSKKKWMNGSFTNTDPYEKQPPKTMCPLRAESWGEILEAELARETKRST